METPNQTEPLIELNTSIPTQQQNVTQICKYCKKPIPQNVFFCPNCGKKLKEPPLSTSIWKQLSIYTVSILLPPLGLIPAIKYIFSGQKHTKPIGIITIILTIISIYITFIYTMNLYNNLMFQFKDLQNLGY